MISGWVVATKTALGYSTVKVTAAGMELGATAIDPSGDLATRALDGGASVVMLGVAVTAIYALLRGHIVPMAAFEDRLKSIEKSISDAATSAKEGAASLASHARDTADSSKRIETLTHELLTEVRSWKK